MALHPDTIKKAEFKVSKSQYPLVLKTKPRNNNYTRLMLQDNIYRQSWITSIAFTLRLLSPPSYRYNLRQRQDHRASTV